MKFLKHGLLLPGVGLTCLLSIGMLTGCGGAQTMLFLQGPLPAPNPLQKHPDRCHGGRVRGASDRRTSG